MSCYELFLLQSLLDYLPIHNPADMGRQRPLSDIAEDRSYLIFYICLRKPASTGVPPRNAAANILQCLAEQAKRGNLNTEETKKRFEILFTICLQELDNIYSIWQKCSNTSSFARLFYLHASFLTCKLINGEVAEFSDTPEWI
jgi:hypothetical protein